MENFFIRCTDDIQLDSEGRLYSHGAAIAGQSIVDGPVRISVPFAVKHFLNLKYDYLLLSSNSQLFRTNKKKRELELLGQITDEVYGIYTNRNVFFVMTTRELMLFNEYFDLVHKLEYNFEEFFGEGGAPGAPISWADGLYSVYGRRSMLILSGTLDVLKRRFVTLWLVNRQRD